MSKLIINSKNKLDGEVTVSGSKNAALPILAASLAMSDISRLKNIAELSDIDIMMKIMSYLGCALSSEGDEITINSKSILNKPVPFELAGKIRASFIIAGALLARFGYAKVALPGGCTIGARPIDLHLKGFKALGADCFIRDGYAELSARKLIGNTVYLDFPSVGATQNIMIAASVADGKTIIENSASEPEVNDLANYLNNCGANIKGAGTDRIEIFGVSSLKGCSHSVIPDRIEAGTFMLAAAATGGKVILKNINATHLASVTSKLAEIGVEATEFGNDICVECRGQLKSTDVKTLPFPGFPTDMQAQTAALLSSVNGTSVITETIFENRFMYIPELIRMNADIKTEGRTAVICGKNNLKGAEVTATDLRAGAALAIAGLCASGKTVINNAELINRGYSSFSDKLLKLGADIKFEL